MTVELRETAVFWICDNCGAETPAATAPLAWRGGREGETVTHHCPDCAAALGIPHDAAVQLFGPYVPSHAD